MARFLFLFAAVLSHSALFAQFRPVNPRNTHERIVAIVPMVGGDPIPGKPGKKTPRLAMLTDLPGLISYRAIESDNGNFALVELVAKDRQSLIAVQSHSGFSQARITPPAGLPPGLALRGEFHDSGRIDGVLADFQKLKKGFRAEHFGVHVQ